MAEGILLLHCSYTTIQKFGVAALIISVGIWFTSPTNTSLILLLYKSSTTNSFSLVYVDFVYSFSTPKITSNLSFRGPSVAKQWVLSVRSRDGKFHSVNRSGLTSPLSHLSQYHQEHRNPSGETQAHCLQLQGYQLKSESCTIMWGTVYSLCIYNLNFRKETLHLHLVKKKYRTLTIIV